LEHFFSGTKNKSEQLFIAQRKKELIYQNLFYKISYDSPPLEKLVFYQTHFKRFSPTSYKFSEQISFNSPDLLNNSFFLRFSRMFFMELVFRFQKEEKIKFSKEEFYDKLFFFINQLSANKLCNAVLKASFMKDEISFMVLNQTTTESTYSRFIDSLLSYRQIRDEAKIVERNFYKKLNELYAFKKGSWAPSCNNITDTSGRVVSLSSFKGKLLYIDVWASWCGKCIEAMPYWDKLVDKYKDNNDVAFIMVSTDDEEEKEKWLRLLNKFKPKGQHFISLGGSNSELAKEFLVNTYPTNILIDREGRIIDIKAERPETIDLSTYLR
jgi:thiol-disulfide isomerase/thioredoxin